jgi:hypothetical protein
VMRHKVNLRTVRRQRQIGFAGLRLNLFPPMG